MLTRIITAVVALIVFAPILYFSNTWPFTVFACLMGAISSYEITKCCGLNKRLSIVLPTILVFTAIPFCTRDVFGTGLPLIKYAVALLLVYLFYVFAASVFSHGKAPIVDCCTAFTMCIYACAGFCSMVMLRDLPGNGAYMFPLIFMGAWVTDTGAYFSGVFLGKHKLIPDVSPKKTVEGAVGGVLITTIVFVLYGFGISRLFGATANYIGLAVMGVVISVISMIGDLIASLVKRHYDIKDYGNLFPGHGGVMDRFDSIIATSLFIFVLTNISDFFILFN